MVEEERKVRDVMEMEERWVEEEVESKLAEKKGKEYEFTCGMSKDLEFKLVLCSKPKEAELNTFKIIKLSLSFSNSIFLLRYPLLSIP